MSTPDSRGGPISCGLSLGGIILILRAAPILLALVFAATVAGCGESKPKRLVDARSEVLRFFAVDAPALILLQRNPAAQVSQINRSANDLATWDRLRGGALGPLHAAGLRRADVIRLAHPREQIEGVDAAALALGFPTPASLAASEPLVIYASDRVALLSRLLARGADRGRLKRVGQVDEARLYRGRGDAFAIRDGVLVSAPRLAEVRAAIERRDGDRSQQLDDHSVRSLFDQLPSEGSLLVYADLRAVQDADPGLRALARQVPWIEALGQLAGSVQPMAGSVRLEVAAKSAGADLTASGLAVGEAPTRFNFSSSNAASLLSVGGPTDPLRQLLLGMAPLAVEATASSDELRAKVVASP